MARRILFAVNFVFSLSACTATEKLSVQLYHPQTKAVQNCNARESNGKDIPALSAAVEACARQLEARGYVRVEKSHRDE